MDYELRLSKNVSSSKSNISLDINLISWDKRGGGMTMSRGFAGDTQERKAIVTKQQRTYAAYVS